MFIVLDGKELKEVCEMELARLKQNHTVELVLRMDREMATVTTKDRTYSYQELSMGKLRLS